MLSVFLLPVLEYFSSVQCSAADTHLEQLDRVVSGARFLTGGVFECDIVHRRSVAVLCMFCKIRYNPMPPLNGALSGPYVPGRGTCSVLVAHRYTYAPPRCRTSEYRMTFVPLALSVPPERYCWSCTRWCGTGGFQEHGQWFFIGLSCSIPIYNCLLLFSFSLLSVYTLVLWGGGLRTDRVYITLSQPCTPDLF